MYLKFFYDEDLAQASYLLGCQTTGEAVVIDPARHIAPYLQAAAREGLRVVGAAETHIHADFVSGSRELAERAGARLYLSNEGGEDWKYRFAAGYERLMLRDGDHFEIGHIRLDVLHTPGHTPEHLAFLITDRGGGADHPMGIFTGDFVFVGSVGRPDLLEKAAGIADTSIVGARQLFASLARFRALPDYLQVWPGHGAGSACGKGLGSIPSSTVGYEKRFNPALAYDDEATFVAMLLDGQPEPPHYFAIMKQVNRDGPPLLRDRRPTIELAPEELPAQLEQGQLVIDTRRQQAFARAHVPGTINIPLPDLASWAGWIVDYGRPLYLIVGRSQVERASLILAAIGIDDVPGFFDADLVERSALASEAYGEEPAPDLAADILNDGVVLVDVRNQTEWDEGRLPRARHIMLGYLREQADQLVTDRPIVVHCRTGHRSAIAASILQAHGARQVINMKGGYRDWAAAGLPIEK